MLCYCAGPAYRMCRQQTFTELQALNKTGSVAPKGTITHHFFRFWNWAEENCRCSQNLKIYAVAVEAQQHHDCICMSVLPRSPAGFSGIFVALENFCKVNGVITVVNTAHDGRTMMQITRRRYRGDSAHTSISLTVRQLL
ncbi:hypothetical protein CEXT_233571 [Caerostris extrusa]|uniref:Uncharacterized protein n=1 Tax=Caerostris extrusa TaxID=172846 RepID=A0AAV4XVZ4_CAEEX|nr:hypothetical protein CEXT_233571 [Caerostris extrusa]